MDMIKSRNLSTHTYNEQTAREITEAIIQKYFNEFEKLIQKFGELEAKTE